MDFIHRRRHFSLSCSFWEMFNISPPKRSSFTAAIRLTVPTAAKATAAFRFRSKMKWALLIGRFLTQSVNRGDNSNV